MKYVKKQTSLDVLQERLKAQEWSVAYLFFGEEGFLRDKALQNLKAAFLPQGEDDFSFRSFHFPDAEVDGVIDELGTLSFFGQHKLIVLNDFDSLKDKDAVRVVEALPKQFDGTSVVFLCTKVDRRKNYFKFLIDKTVALEFKPLFDNQVGGWIRSLSLEKGKEIHAEAIASLHRRVGSHLGELDLELRKLSEFVGDRSQIELEDVETVVDSSKAQSIFELTDSIGRKDTFQSLAILKGLVSQGQSEVGVVSLIARHLRILLTAKAGMARDFSDSELAQACGVPPYFLKQYLEQSRRWSDQELKKGLLHTAQTERRLKSSGAAPEILLDALILDLGSPR